MSEESNDILETINDVEPIIPVPTKEAHVRMMPEDYESVPFVWRNDYIAPGATNKDISIGDVIAIYTNYVQGAAAYDVGEVLNFLYRWCKTGDPQDLQRAYEFMYHLSKYLYDAGVGRMVVKKG